MNIPEAQTSKCPFAGMANSFKNFTGHSAEEKFEIATNTSNIDIKENFMDKEFTSDKKSMLQSSLDGA